MREATEVSNNNKQKDFQEIRIPDLKNSPQNVPLIVAAMNGCVEQNQELMDSKTNEKIVCLKTLVQNKKLSSEIRQFLIPYLLMFEKLTLRRIPNRYAVIKFLVEQGLEANIVLLSHYKDSRTVGEEKETIDYDFELMRAMLDGGVNPNLQIEGYTILHAAIVSQDHFHWHERIDLLLNKGTNPNTSEIARGMGTALHVALANEAFDDKTPFVKARYLIQKLVGTSFDWDIRDSEHKTPLIMAAKMRATDVIELLINQIKEHKIQLNLDAQDNKGRTALHFCCALGDIRSVQFLFDKGASTTIRDKEGKSIVDYTKLSSTQITAMLCEIHIDSSRDEKALHNYIIDLNGHPICSKTFTGEKMPCRAEQKNQPILQSILNQFKNLRFPSEKEKEYDLNFMKIQFQFTGRSLLASCIEGQKEVLSFLKSRFAIDKKSENPYQFFQQDGIETPIERTEKHINRS